MFVIIVTHIFTIFLV